MELLRVSNKKTESDFLNVARIMYSNDPNFICPLDSIVNSVFDKNKNSYFLDGEAQRWILKDKNGKLIGRIASFFHWGKAKKYNPPTGGIGFFECINDTEAAFKLFDASKEWLLKKGMGAMDGPVNFGENDNFWGLLVDGFTPPAFGMNYNPPYYKNLFENYGFKPFFEQETKHLNLEKPFPERFWKIAEWIMRKPGYTFEHFRKRDLDKFASDIVEIYNSAWINHEHFSPLTIGKIKKGFEEAKNILIEDFIWFAYHEGKPIAFLVMFPDMNLLFKSFNGKMHLWNKLRFLLLKNSKKVNRSRITILGVIPQFQGAGVESAIFWHLRNPLFNKRPHYKEIEISWVGDFNPKMKATLDAMKADPGKTHITYRKLFDENAIFKRAATVFEVEEKMKSSGS